MKELEETMEAHALFIVDPYDRTVNKGNTVLRGRETALMDKMLETLHLLRDTGKLIK
jgi:hypothetical protein